VLRIIYVDGRVVERDVVGAINIGLKYFILRWEARGVWLNGHP
jgi:transposase